MSQIEDLLQQEKWRFSNELLSGKSSPHSNHSQRTICFVI